MASPASSSRSGSGVLRLAAPLVVSFWMRSVVTFVDTIYAALLGDAEVAAIGLTVPFEFLMIAIWVGLSTGLTSNLSRAMGSGEGAKIEQYLATTRRLVAVITPLFSAVGVAIWFGAPLTGLDADVTGAFRVYGTVLIAGSAFTSFWSILPDSLVKAHHDTRSTMWAGIWTNLINVSLNTLFLFVFGWGIFGIALSTVISRLGGLLYALIQARRHETRRLESGQTPGTGLDPTPLRTILRLAVPSSLTFMLMALEMAVVNGLLASVEHATENIAAYSIYYRVVLFSLQPVIAISVAMLPFAARRFGAGDLPGIRRGFRDAGLTTVGYAVLVLGPLMWWLSPWIAGSLSESPITAGYATVALRTVPLAAVAGTLFLLCRPVFEAMNQGRPGLVMAGLRYLALTGPLAWAGMHAAATLEQPPLFGLIAGLLAAAAVSSGLFFVWLTRVLPQPTISESAL